MMQLGITLFFVIIGMLIGNKRREFLLYLLFVLFPFFGLGTIKGINMTFSDLAVYMCAIPQGLFLITHWVGRHEKSPDFAGLIILLTVFTLYLFNRYLASVHPDRLYFFKCLLFGMIIFVYTLNYCKEMEPKMLVRMTGMMILFQSVLAFMQMKMGFEISRIFMFIDMSGINPSFAGGMSVARGTGTFPDPNYFALYVGVLTSSLLPAIKRLMVKFLYFLGLAGILCSFSRMGILICGILLGIYFWKNVRINSARQVGIICLWLAGLIVAGSWIITNYAQIPITSTMVERFRYNDGNIGDVEGTRNYILKFYYHHLMDLPNPGELLTGLGLENFEYLLDAKTGIFLVAHNEYLQIFADIGLLGYVFLLAIVIYLRRKSRKKAAGVNPYTGPVLVMLFGFFFLTCTYEMYCYFYLALFFGYRIFQEDSCRKPLLLWKERNHHGDQSGPVGNESLYFRPAGGILRQDVG